MSLKDIQLLHLMQFGEAREAFRDQHSTSFTGHFHLRSGDISFARCLVFGISNWTDKGKDKDFPLRSRDISPELEGWKQVQKSRCWDFGGCQGEISFMKSDRDSFHKSFP